VPATDFTDNVARAQEQAISSLRQAQDLTLEAAKAAMRVVPAAASPWLAAAPTAKEAVETAFDFAGQILEQQKAFALQATELLAQGTRTSATRG
jgi:hypothetical protein